ncbi:hypothetical protein KXR64_20305 [Brucella intermedia]|uniref:hypothetical protein n=1 Tax=Brucella TaxID=234 RepID=UPI0009D74181|nr:hypothetical protein [Brucella intermedia]
MIHSSDIRSALNSLVPLVEDYWDSSVSAYSAALYDGFQTNDLDVRQDAFGRLVKLLRRRALQSGYSDAEAHTLTNQLRCRPVIQTGPHCHLIIEPDAFFTHLFSIMGLKALAECWHIHYSVSTVKFIEKAKKGPGWLWLDGQHVNVFGLSRSKMEPYSVCGRQDRFRFLLTSPNDQAPRPALDRLSSILPEDEFPSAAEAIKTANQHLWPNCFGCQNKYLQLDDADLALLVLDHLLDPTSWLSRHFFDAPHMVAAFMNEVKKLDLGPWAGWFKFGTDFFWRIRDGRIKRLKLENNRLRDEAGTFELHLNSRSLAEALEAEEIMPGLFLVFLVLSILPGTRVLGGSRQVVYYPLMRLAFLSALDSSAAPVNKVLAESVRSDRMPSVWGHRTIAPAFASPWELYTTTGDDPEARELILEAFAGRTLISASAGLPSFLEDELWARLCVRAKSGHWHV